MARLLVVLAISGLLHWVVLGWAGHNFAQLLPSMQQEPSVVMAQLHSAPGVPAVPAAEKTIPHRQKPAERAAEVRPPLRQPALEPTAVTSAVESDIPLTPVADSGSAEGAAAANLSELTEDANQESDATSVPAEPNPTARPLMLPPSADLEYAVSALRDGNAVFGHGSISWRSDGRQYSVSGKTGILFFSLLNFQSNGEIDSLGLAPVLYSEKRFRRPETNTHFQHEARRISFSSSTASYPRQGGEQDRASIVWQLASVAASRPEALVPGARFSMFVAGTRNGEVWNMDVIGEDTVETGIGTATAWHLRRSPREKSYDQQLEIWLSPSQHWYPVRMRFTENNGEYLDMTLSTLTPRQASGNNASDATRVASEPAESDIAADGS